MRALEAQGFPISEMAIRGAEAAARRDLDLAILERWKLGARPSVGLPRTGWIEAQVWRDYWRQVLEACGAEPHRIEPLVESVLRVTRPAASWDRVESGTPALLSDLAVRGYRLGVISNSSGTLSEHLLRLGLADRFEVIVDSAHVGVEKPHPEIFHLALRMAGAADAARALYVGDVYAIDVLGAAGAGLQARLFDPSGTWDGAWLPAGMPGCRTIGSLEDLREELL